MWWGSTRAPYRTSSCPQRQTFAPHHDQTTGHEKPKWTQYSLRRAGERSARDNQHRHGLPRAEIDLYSGWDLYKHSRDKQLHYAGQDRQHRCDITRWI